MRIECGLDFVERRGVHARPPSAGGETVSHRDPGLRFFEAWR
jgi:hypothetical protein